jgi:hypothetical protein
MKYFKKEMVFLVNKAHLWRDNRMPQDYMKWDDNCPFLFVVYPQYRIALDPTHWLKEVQDNLPEEIWELYSSAVAFGAMWQISSLHIYVIPWKGSFDRINPANVEDKGTYWNDGRFSIEEFFSEFSDNYNEGVIEDYGRRCQKDYLYIPRRAGNVVQLETLNWESRKSKFLEYDYEHRIRKRIFFQQFTEVTQPYYSSLGEFSLYYDVIKDRKKFTGELPARLCLLFSSPVGPSEDYTFYTPGMFEVIYDLPEWGFYPRDFFRTTTAITEFLPSMYTFLSSDFDIVMKHGEARPDWWNALLVCLKNEKNIILNTHILPTLF